PGVKITLKHPDQVGTKGYSQRKGDQPDKRSQITTNQSIINDSAGKNSREKMKNGRKQDCQQDQHHLFPVWLKVLPDSPQQLSIDFRAIGLLFLGQESTAAHH